MEISIRDCIKKYRKSLKSLSLIFKNFICLKKEMNLFHQCDSIQSNTTVECGWSGITKEECEDASRNVLKVPCCFNQKLEDPHLHCFPQPQGDSTSSILLIILIISLSLGIFGFVCCRSSRRKDKNYIGQNNL